MKNRKQLKQMVKNKELASYNVDETVLMNNGDAVMRCLLTVWHTSDNKPHVSTGFSYGSPKNVKRLADDALGEAMEFLTVNEDIIITQEQYLESLIN